MRTNSPTKIMAVDYTPSSGSCGPAPGIWTLTEIAQRLSRTPNRPWPKSLLTVAGPTEYRDFSVPPIPGAAIDILLKCRTTTAVSTGNTLECDTFYDYAAGVQWEVSKDYGASWQPLDNRYNLKSQKISIGQRLRADEVAHSLVAACHEALNGARAAAEALTVQARLGPRAHPKDEAEPRGTIVG